MPQETGWLIRAGLRPWEPAVPRERGGASFLLLSLLLRGLSSGGGEGSQLVLRDRPGGCQTFLANRGDKPVFEPLCNPGR